MINITIAGRLTRDATLRFTADSSPVLGFDVACDVGYADKKHAVYIACSLWGKRAESLDPWLKKGTSVTVTGAGDLRLWESNGKSGASIELRVNEVALQGSKPDSDSQAKPAKPGGFRDNTAAEAFDEDKLPF